MGTTKLTRKEILSEDPVHLAMVHIVEFFRTQGKTVLAGAAALLVVGAGIYFGLQYLKSRDAQAQLELSRGLDFYHAPIDPTAQDDPYDKGIIPTFRNDTARYQAALKVFSSVASNYRFSKLSVLAKYYQGLCQLQLGQKDEAVKSLESLRNNTKDRTVGYVAKKVLAGIYLSSGNAQGAQEAVESMLGDPQCELPKDELRVQLAQIYVAQGKKDQAIKLLREAREMAQTSRSMLQSQISQELARIEGGGQSGTVQTVPVPANLSVPR